MVVMGRSNYAEFQRMRRANERRPQLADNANESEWSGKFAEKRESQTRSP